MQQPRGFILARAVTEQELRQPVPWVVPVGDPLTHTYAHTDAHIDAAGTAEPADDGAAARAEIQAYVAAARKHATEFADRYALGRPVLLHPRSATPEDVLSRRRRTHTHVFGTAEAHLPPAFHSHVQFARPVVRSGVLFHEDAAEDGRAVNAEPHRFRVAPVAGTVHNASSRAEQKARLFARVRLLQLLGPEHGHTPASIGESHVPRPLRMHRLQKAASAQQLGPGSYTVSDKGQQYCARGRKAVSGPAWRTPTVCQRDARKAQPGTASAQHKHPAPACEPAAAFIPPLQPASCAIEPDENASIRGVVPPLDSSPLLHPAVPESKQHALYGDGSSELTDDSWSSSEDTWASDDIERLPDLITGDEPAKLPSGAMEPEQSVQPTEVGSQEECKADTPCIDIAAMVAAIKREAARRVAAGVPAPKRHSTKTELDATQRKSVRNVIIAPTRKGAHERIKAAMSATERRRRRALRGRSLLPRVNLHTAFDSLQKVSGAVDLLLRLASGWDGDVPSPHPAATKPAAEIPKHGVLQERVASGRWTTSWSRELRAQEHAERARAARQARHAPLVGHAPVGDAHRIGGAVAIRRIQKLLRDYARQASFDPRIATFPQKSGANRSSRARSLVDMARSVGRRDLSDSISSDTERTSSAEVAFHAAVLPIPYKVRTSVQFAKMTGREDHAAGSRQPAEHQEPATTIRLAIPRGRPDARRPPSFSFSKADRTPDVSDDDGHDKYYVNALVDRQVAAPVDNAVFRRRAASAPPFSLQAGREHATRADDDDFCNFQEDVFRHALLDLQVKHESQSKFPRSSRRLDVDWVRQTGREGGPDSKFDDNDDAGAIDALYPHLPPKHVPRLVTKSDATPRLPLPGAQSVSRFDDPLAVRVRSDLPPQTRALLRDDFDLGV